MDVCSRRGKTKHYVVALGTLVAVALSHAAYAVTYENLL